jgi:hypothetical protein
MKGASKPLKAEQRAELAALAALPDAAIDTSDAAEVLDWSGAKRGLFYRPQKQQLTRRRRRGRLVQSASHLQRGLSDADQSRASGYVHGHARKRPQSKRA